MRNRPITLIDTGLPTQHSFQQLKSGLASVGLSVSDLDQIILTHMHDDHMGGVTKLQEETNIPLYIHEQATLEITNGTDEAIRRKHFLDRFYEQCGLLLNTTKEIQSLNYNWHNVHFLKEGDRIFAGGKNYEVLYTPGHSQSDICLWDHASGDAFVGDFLVKLFSPNAFITQPAPNQKERPKPLLQLRNSFRKVYHLPFKMIYPGHGNPFSNHQALINQRFSEQKERCAAIYKILESDPETVSVISNKLFPWLKGHAKFLGLSEIQGHLDLMVKKSQVYTEQDNKLLLYKVHDSA